MMLANLTRGLLLFGLLLAFITVASSNWNAPLAIAVILVFVAFGFLTLVARTRKTRDKEGK